MLGCCGPCTRYLGIVLVVWTWYQVLKYIICSTFHRVCMELLAHPGAHHVYSNTTSTRLYGENQNHTALHKGGGNVYLIMVRLSRRSPHHTQFLHQYTPTIGSSPKNNKTTPNVAPHRHSPSTHQAAADHTPPARVKLQTTPKTQKHELRTTTVVGPSPHSYT